MAVDTTKYGNYITHVGTLAEVMGALNGKNPSIIISVFYDSNTSKVNAIVKYIE